MSFSRDLDQLRNKTFDLVVIGGGIDGATIAWEATLRGLKTALIERGDFGGATSAGNFKILHGGLRYLQHLDLKRLYESVGEQRNFRIIAPHLLRPLPFVVPCYGWGMRGKPILTTAVSLYDRLTSKRNRGVARELALEGFRVLSTEECLREAPGLPEEGLKGGVVFFDAQMKNPDRLTFAFVRSGISRGLVAANYVEAVGARISEDRGGQKIAAVIARDVETGAQIEVAGRFVVNATGPFGAELLAKLLRRDAPATELLFSKGLQVVLPGGIVNSAVSVESRFSDKTAVVSRGSRSYFLVPWRQHTLLGTADILHRGSASEFRLSQDEVARFVTEAREAYEHELIDVQHVRHVFGGLRPIEPAVKAKLSNAESGTFGSIEAAHRDVIAEDRDVANVLSVEGIKYTTARLVAEQSVDRVLQKLSMSPVASSSAGTVLHGGDLGTEEMVFVRFGRELTAHVGEAKARELCGEYGSDVVALLQLFKTEPSLEKPVAGTNGIVGAQVVFAVRDEMARRLSDVVLRRTGLGTIGIPGVATLRAIASLMGSELGWDEGRRESEVSSLLGVASSLSPRNHH